ncbi:MAG: lysozyme [Pseudomonadota bacterium]
MARRMRTSKAGLDLIMGFEGFRARSEPLDDGRFIIGFGHTALAKQHQKISFEDARLILQKRDLAPVEEAIASRVLAPLTQNEFDALVAFAFNIGLENFLASDVFALVNSGAKLRAAEAMAAWRKARVDGRVIVVDGLVRRRAAERALFLEPDTGRTAVPTPIVQPQLDLAAAILSPRDAARRIEVQSGQGRAEIVEDDEAAESAPESTSGESAPEAAARKVRERLTRILGEPTDQQTDDTDPNSGPSVDEITRALKELADPVEDGDSTGDAAPTPRIQPQAERRVPPAQTARLIEEDESAFGPSDYDPTWLAGTPVLVEDEPEEIGDPRPTPPPRNAAPAPSLGMIDDLEPTDLDTDDLDAPQSSGPRASWASVILFALAAFGGALIAAWGLRDLSDFMSSSVPGSDWDLYSGPFAILIGGLIFIIMAYYLFQALFAEN